jgi:plastocyanin
VTQSRPTRLGILVGAIALLAGCTSASPQQPAASTAPASAATTAPTGAATSAPSSAQTVTISNFTFSPATLTVAKGTTVTFTNNDGAPHTVTPEHGATFTAISNLNAGQSGTVTFNTSGEQDYFCTYHQGMAGMHAKVIVP